MELNIAFWDKETKMFLLFGLQLTCFGLNQAHPFKAGKHQIEFTLPKGILWVGEYHVNMALHRSFREILQIELESLTLRIENAHELVDLYRGMKPGKFFVRPEKVVYYHE